MLLSLYTFHFSPPRLYTFPLSPFTFQFSPSPPPGGIGRPNNDVVVGQCDPIAERERQVSSVKSMRFVLCKVVYSLLSL